MFSGLRDKGLRRVAHSDVVDVSRVYGFSGEDIQDSSSNQGISLGEEGYTNNDC